MQLSVLGLQALNSNTNDLYPCCHTVLSNSCSTSHQTTSSCNHGWVNHRKTHINRVLFASSIVCTISPQISVQRYNDFMMIKYKTENGMKLWQVCKMKGIGISVFMYHCKIILLYLQPLEDANNKSALQTFQKCGHASANESGSNFTIKLKILIEGRSTTSAHLSAQWRGWSSVTQLFIPLRHSFHHLGARTQKSLEACLPCTLKTGRSSQAMLDVGREHGTEDDLLSAFRQAGTGLFLAQGSYRKKEWREHTNGVVWESFKKQAIQLDSGSLVRV